MLQIEASIGSAPDWILGSINRDGSTPTGFLGTDALTSSLWAGGTQAALLSPTVAWSDYTVGSVAISLSNAQMATLEYAGEYHGSISATRSGKTVVIIEFTLKVDPAPGTGTETVAPYCSVADMLAYAPWLTMLQDDTSDLEGYYQQRLQAKNWLDWLIIRSYRGTSASFFGDPGRSAQYWMGGWARRSALPSQWLMDQLSGGIVLQPLTLTASGSGYSYATVTFTGGGPAAKQATASAVVSGGQVISLQLIQAGTGYTSIPTITITGDGTGATATCTIAANVLMIRPSIVEACALKAASFVGLGQMGRQNTVAVFGALWRDMASSKAVSIVAELDLNGDGQADLAIPLIVTNTLST